VFNFIQQYYNKFIYFEVMMAEISYAYQTKEFDIHELELLIVHYLKINGYQIHPEDVWRLLFMERVYIETGKLSYEKEEPGYLLGMLRGYLHMLRTLDLPLTPELYKELHDYCVRGVKSKEEPDGIPLGFRKLDDGGESFGLQEQVTLSLQGFQELCDRYDNYWYKDEVTNDIFFPLQEALFDPKRTIFLQSPNASLSIKQKSFIKLKKTREETITINIKFLLGLYENNLKNDPIRAIIRLCQDLDQFHFFVDGNIRTTGILVLNRELLRARLRPAVLLDVNFLDCLGETELMKTFRSRSGVFL